MTNLRPFLMRAGGAIRRRLAYRLVNEYRLAEQQQAIYLRRLLHVLRIDCVLDVGGNAGQFYTECGRERSGKVPRFYLGRGWP